MQGPAAPEQSGVEERREACGWKHPWAPSVGTLFQDDRETPAFLTFFRETRVGGMISLAPMVEEGREEGEVRRGGITIFPGNRLNLTHSCSSVLSQARMPP